MDISKQLSNLYKEANSSATFYRKNEGEGIGGFVQQYMKTRVSYSGCDMVATITIPQLGGVDGINPIFVIGELHTLSYSIHTEDKPVRSFASKGIKAFTSGPRTIAGSMVFSVFDRHVFRNISEELVKRYSTKELGSQRSIITHRILADELPPFNITITFANEYGNQSTLTLYGIHIQDEGQVMSLDDIMTENTMSFFALDITLMDKMVNGQRPGNSILNGVNADTNDKRGPKYGDYYVYGTVYNSDGEILKLSDPSNYSINILTQDNQVISTSMDTEGNYFTVTATPPQKVTLIVEIDVEITVLDTNTSGNGHKWDLHSI
jgi:hypothetical protein